VICRGFGVSNLEYYLVLVCIGPDLNVFYTNQAYYIVPLAYRNLEKVKIVWAI